VAFAGHARETPWDRLHLIYFLGCAVWNYLTTPFLFARMGFATRELDAHVAGREDGSTTSPTCWAASQRTTAMTT
jgi:hypothetical protein